jgi:hypothetical protein
MRAEPELAREALRSFNTPTSIFMLKLTTPTLKALPSLLTPFSSQNKANPVVTPKYN